MTERYNWQSIVQFQYAFLSCMLPFHTPHQWLTTAARGTTATAATSTTATATSTNEKDKVRGNKEKDRDKDKDKDKDKENEKVFTHTQLQHFYSVMQLAYGASTHTVTAGTLDEKTYYYY
jgi:Ni/Co efflux regulator RcnB